MSYQGIKGINRKGIGSMTVRELTELKDFTEIAILTPDEPVTGVYIGDLLSWVMGRATKGDAWITIMTNVNILAVASLAEVSCVILAEGTELSPELIETAKGKNINVISSNLPAYEIAKLLAFKGL